MQKSVVSVRGQTVIPKEVRELLGVEPGSEIRWFVRDGVVTIRAVPKDPVHAMRGVLKGKGSFGEFIAEREADRQRERELENRQDTH